MSQFNAGFLGTFRQYAGKLKTMRDEARTVRMLDSLPADLRKDIGWPGLRRRSDFWKLAVLAMAAISITALLGHWG